MKALHTCLSESWGGMEMLTLKIARELMKRNIDLELLCVKNSRLHEEARKAGVKVVESGFRRQTDIREIFRTKNILRKGNFDIIHSGASKDLWLISPALKLAGLDTPFLLTKHVGSFIIKKDFLHRWIYGRLNYALAISSVIKKNLAETTPLTEDKILLFQNSIDTKRFNPETADGKTVRKQFGIDNKTIALGMMARFSPGKGHEEFLYAAKELLINYDNLLFLIIGEASRGEDEYASGIRNLSERLGIKDKIIFTGFRSDTPEVLAALDIFVFPSHAEAFGLALGEAMSMGKPSVCSNSDGVLDLAIDNETSFLFERQNSADLAAKLSLLVESPELRSKFGSAARERIVKYFDEENYITKLIGLYDKLINGQPGSIN